MEGWPHLQHICEFITVSFIMVSYLIVVKMDVHMKIFGVMKVKKSLSVKCVNDNLKENSEDLV